MANTGPRSGAEPPPSGTEDGNSGANKQHNLLKFFIIAANRDLEDIGLVRPLAIKDLDNLDQDTFIKILKYLLTASGIYTSEQMTGKVEVLLNLTEAGLPRLEYDASMDYIYWAVKRLFPENDDTFSYGILLNPKSDTKAVKQTIQYLTEFTVFTDTCSEAFEEINAVVAEEHALRSELHRKIDEINITIAEKKAEMEEKNQILPEMQTKLSEVNSDLAKEEDALAAMELEVEKFKGIYEADEQDKHRLERQFEEIVEFRKKLETRIIVNPEFVQKMHKAEMDNLNALVREREELGQKLKLAEVDNKETEDLISKSEALLTRLNACTETMGEVDTAAEDLTKIQDNLKSLHGTLNWVVTNLKHLTLTRDKIKEINAEEMKGLKIRIQVTSKQLLVLKEKNMNLKADFEAKRMERAKSVKTVAALKQRIKFMEERLRGNHNYLTKELPASIDAVVKETEGLLEELKSDLDIMDKNFDSRTS